MRNPIPMPNFVGSDCDDMKGYPCRGCPCGSGYPGGNTNAEFPNPFGKVCGRSLFLPGFSPALAWTSKPPEHATPLYRTVSGVATWSPCRHLALYNHTSPSSNSVKDPNADPAVIPVVPSGPHGPEHRHPGSRTRPRPPCRRVRCWLPVGL